MSSRATLRRPEVSVRSIGDERRPLVTIDAFAADPDALRAAAAAAEFGPAAHHYPGVRAALPAHYLESQLPLIADAAAHAFGKSRRIAVIDACFAIVSTPRDALTVRQRLPHVDAFGEERIALIHYLQPGGRDGTAFYRHRATGFETIDERRAPIFFDQLEAELRLSGAPPQDYVVGDTPLFEQIERIDARYNRALLYPSCLLHSGAIARDARLSPDPAKGRLTITGFLALE